MLSHARVSEERECLLENAPVLVVCVRLGHRPAAMAAQASGIPFVQGDPLASSLREWVNALWPSAPLRRRTVLELALSRVREGHALVMSPDGQAVKEASSTASGSDDEICYHGCNPRQLAQILNGGLLPTLGKHDILGVWSSPHMHTAAQYPMALKDGQAVLSIGPALRVILKLQVKQSSIIRRIRGKKNRAGVPVNYQWPLRPEGIRIVSIHMWCYDGHANPDKHMSSLSIVQEKKNEQKFAMLTN